MQGGSDRPISAWRRLAAFLGLFAAIIAGPLSWCVHGETAAAAAVARSGLAGERTLRSHRLNDSDSCRIHIYVHRRVSLAYVHRQVSLTLPHLAPDVPLPFAWRGPDRGVPPSWVSARTGPVRIGAVPFAPRGPPAFG